MSTWRQHVTYDAAFASVDRWMLSPSGIRIRFRMASGPEHVVDFTLEESRLRLIDSDTWATAPLEVPECVGRIEFVLRGAPEPITQALRSALETSPTSRPPPRPGA